jgi:hypothetical protein
MDASLEWFFQQQLQRIKGVVGYDVTGGKAGGLVLDQIRKAPGVSLGAPGRGAPKSH